jgi:hypothetical protein
MGNGKQVKLIYRGRVIAELDGYCPVSRTCFPYNGCWVHGCPRGKLCPKLKNKTPAQHKALEEKWTKFQLDAEKVLGLFPEQIKNMFFMQECDWEMAKKEHADLRQFCNALKTKPLRHLCFRDAQRGN